MYVTSWIGVAYVALLQRGDYELTKSCKMSSKMLQFILHLFTFFIFACYTALLTSFMTARPQPSEIKDFQDVYENKVHIFLWKNTVNHLDMANSPANSWENKVYSEFIEGKSDRFISDATELEDYFNKHPKALYYGARSELYSIDSIERFISFEKSFQDTYNGFPVLAFPMESEYVELFKHHLKILHQSGVLRKLELDWFTASQNSIKKEDDVVPLGGMELFTLFVAMGLGIVASITFVCAERCLYSSNNRKTAAHPVERDAIYHNYYRERHSAVSLNWRRLSY